MPLICGIGARVWVPPAQRRHARLVLAPFAWCPDRVTGSKQMRQVP